MPTTLSIWAERVWRDLQPTPGRLNSSLRIMLASLLALLCLLVWQVPFASISLYFVFLVGRDSPAVSVRSGILSILTLTLSVATELAVVILTGDDPLARVVAVAVVTFLAGVLMLSTTLTALASTWGFIFCTLIALWETKAPADALVKQSLWLVAAGTVAVGSSVAVEYVFATRHPADKLQEQRTMRYRSLQTMFGSFAQGAEGEALRDAVIPVARLAAAGQEGMLHLYNALVERNLDTGTLPMATRVRIAMLAQLMDVAAAFGTNNLMGVDAESRAHCGRIAALCGELSRRVIPDRETALPPSESLNPTLLDRVDGILHNIVSMPDEEAANKRRELVALPAREVPILLPGALHDRATVAFGLKLSLCATVCYVFYHAVDWPGISTSVTTVLIAGLSTTGAIKQRLIFRLWGAIIGGLILGLGATAFLFPHMDTITSLVILVAAIAFFSAWWAAGRQFNYIGLQIAFSFYLVAFEGSSAPTDLSPPRDRLIGILIALIVMAIVFDLIWPVRTITAMRRSLASVLHAVADLFGLMDLPTGDKAIVGQANALRDRIGKTIAALRALNDVVDYEFGTDREKQALASQTMLRAAFTAAGIFWNQFAVLHSEEDRDFMADSGLIAMRRELRKQIDALADSVARHAPCQPAHLESLVNVHQIENSRFGEYERNTVKQYAELQSVIASLSTQV